jgi:hypothetical protein
MISFDMLSLFKRVPIGEAMSLLSRHFEDDIMRLFRNALKASCICLAARTYKKI